MATESNSADPFEDVVFQFEHAWNQAPLPRIEDFLPDEEPFRTRVLEELVLIDADRRMQLGEEVSTADYLSRLPEFASSAAMQERLQRLLDERSERIYATDGMSRYRVMDFHAKGGLGQISKAADEQLKRIVAIKEIQPQFAEHPTSRQRFLQEAAITGALEHPGIVPVYGLGTFPDGRPYYVMRFIQGTSFQNAIAEWHALASKTVVPHTEVALAFRKLLGHFVTVCDAVQYAHDRGVLHRDLKPSNIMLGHYGETFVVDWGLAKSDDVTDCPTTEPTADANATGTVGEPNQTRTGDKLGTLDYMSPEQASGRTGEVGTAADVYGLGATLYHLLTGVPAFTSRESFNPSPIGVGGADEASAIGKSTRSTHADDIAVKRLDDLVRRVQAGDFPKPRAIVPNVPRALEAICLKAMSLSPQDRYVTARELADDINRWLADEAVLAWPGLWWEHLGRWARRHRIVAAALFGLLFTAVVALAVGTVLLNQERALTIEQRNRAIDAEKLADARRLIAQTNEQMATSAAALAHEQAERADREAQRATQKSAEVAQVASFLVNLFRTADPLSLRGTGFRGGSQELTKLTAGELLKRGVQEIDGLDDQPLVQATLLEHLGDIHRDLGDYGTAKHLLDRAWEQRRKLLESDDPALAETAISLGRWHQDQGDFPEAKEFYERALSIRQQHWSDDSLPVAEVLFYQGWLNSDRDQSGLAEPLFRRAWEIREQRLGARHADTQAAKIFLAMSLADGDRHLEAISMMASDLPLAEIPRGILEYRAAESLRMQSQFDAARARLQPLVDRATELLGKQHPLRAMLLGDLAGIVRQQGHWSEARRFTEEAMAVLEPLMKNHPRQARPLAQVAAGLVYIGHDEEAERRYRHALRLAERGLQAQVGLMDGEFSESLPALADVLLRQGKYDELADWHARGVEFAQQWHNAPDRNKPVFLANCDRFRARQLLAEGKLAEAEGYLANLFELTRYPEDLLLHVECLSELGHDQEADRGRNRARKAALSEAARGQRYAGSIHARLARALIRLEEFDTAEQHLRFAVAVENARRPLGDTERLEYVVDLGRFLRQRGKPEEARQVLEDAIRHLEASVGQHELPTTAARLELAQTYNHLGEPMGVNPRTTTTTQVRGLTPPGSPELMIRGVELARGVLNDRLRELGTTHSAVAEAQRVLADLMAGAPSVPREEIVTLLESAHTNTRQRFGPAHPLVFEVVSQRAEFLRSFGQIDEAERLLTVARREAPDRLPPTSIGRLLLDGVAGAIALDRREFDTAEKLLTFAHQRLQRTVGPHDPRTLRQAERCVRLYETWDKPTEAAMYRALLLPR